MDDTDGARSSAPETEDGVESTANDAALALAFPYVDLSDIARSGDADHSWAALRDRVVVAMSSCGDRPLGSLMPLLRMQAVERLDLRPFRQRTQTIFLRKQIDTWEALLDLTPDSILQFTNASQLTILDVIGVCADTAIAAALRGNRLPIPQVGTQRLEVTSGPLMDAIDLATQWLAAERPGGRIDDAITFNPDFQAPVDVQNALRVALARTSAVGPKDTAVDELIEHLFDGFDERLRLIYLRRELSRPSPTLQALAGLFDLTRERVRQLQERAVRDVRDRLASEAFAPLRWRASDLAHSLGPIAPVSGRRTIAALHHATRDVDPDRLALAQHLMLLAAGPYTLVNDTWLVTDGASVPTRSLADDLLDAHGVASMTRLEEALIIEGLAAEDLPVWIGSNRAFHPYGEFVLRWDGDIGSKIVAILAVRGEPATAEELLRLTGETRSIGSTRNALGAHPEVIRTGRGTWGLRSFGLEEYSGIAEEIGEELASRDGGPAPMREVIDAVSQRFGLSPGSVRTYCGAAMFVIEAGTLRLRGGAEPYPLDQNLSGVSRAYRPSAEVVVLSFTVDRDTQRGSGRSASPNIGACLGVSPGASRRFQTSDGSLIVNWPVTSFMGPSLGSQRALSLAAHTVEGDILALHFDIVAGTVTSHRLPPDWAQNMRPEAALLRLTGLPVTPDLESALAAAIDCSVDDLEAAMSKRGDDAVLELARSFRLG